MKNLNTPILFLIFNRPEITLQVFHAIRYVKPSYLYIAADGPRKNKEGEEQKCNSAREIVSQIDWKCEVKYLLRDTNLGCKTAVSSAINWFFSHVEEGIILEDDCLPDPSFFWYCESLLTYYRNNETIMHISGVDFQPEENKTNQSYYYSKYPLIWGWATWRRAWASYDVTMNDYLNKNIVNKIKKKLKNKKVVKFWFNNFQKVINNEINTWDYQWVYAILKSDGICISPNINLISNIGFNKDATHTKNKSDVSELPLECISVIIHPKILQINEKADNYLFTNIWNQKPNWLIKIFFNKIHNKLKRLKL